MDTPQSLAVFLCLVSASFAFPAGFAPFGFRGKLAPRLPLPAPTTRFQPQAVAQPAVKVQAQPVTVPAPAPAPLTMVQATRPLSRVPVGNVVVSRPLGTLDGSVDNGGDQVVVIRPAGGRVINRGLSTGQTVLTNDGSLDSGSALGGDFSISDSTVNVLPSGSTLMVPSAPAGRLVVSDGGDAGYGDGVEVVRTRSLVLSPNAVTTGTGAVVTRAGSLSNRGVRVVPTPSAVGVPSSIGLQAVVGGDMSISDSTFNMMPAQRLVTLPHRRLAAVNYRSAPDVDLVTLANGQVMMRVSRDTPDLNVVHRVVRPLGQPVGMSSQNIIFTSDSRDSS